MMYLMTLVRYTGDVTVMVLTAITRDTYTYLQRRTTLVAICYLIIRSFVMSENRRTI